MTIPHVHTHNTFLLLQMVIPCLIFLSLRKLCEDNYDTLTRKDFIEYQGPDSKDPLPTRVIAGLSGFAQNTHPTLPTQREVRTCD